jgi:hypothetical protein
VCNIPYPRFKCKPYFLRRRLPRKADQILSGKVKI